MMESRIDQIIRDVAPAFGLPPYWWRVEGQPNACVFRNAKKRHLMHPLVLKTEQWERVHCFCTIIGKCLEQWIGRPQFCEATKVGGGTHAVFSLNWRAFPYEVQKVYLALGGGQANEFRRKEITPWMMEKYSGIFSVQSLKNCTTTKSLH